jgi:hypothetical protein
MCGTQNYWISGLCPSFEIRNTREHDVSGTASVPGDCILSCYISWTQPGTAVVMGNRLSSDGGQLSLKDCGEVQGTVPCSN